MLFGSMLVSLQVVALERKGRVGMGLFFDIVEEGLGSWGDFERAQEWGHLWDLLKEERRYYLS